VVQPAVKGGDVTLTCRMGYDWQAPGKQFNGPPRVNVTLSWIGVSGTMVRTTADPDTFRGTVETNMTIKNVTSDTISSHSCTVQFDFSPGHFSYHYAVNSVSSTCVSKSTAFWCMYTSNSHIGSFVCIVTPLCFYLCWRCLFISLCISGNSVPTKKFRRSLMKSVKSIILFCNLTK